MAFKERMAGPHGETADPRIAAALAARSPREEISCAEAEKLAAELAVSLADVGRTLDAREVRIVRCQLGLFGYNGKGKAVTPAPHVEAAMRAAIAAALADGRLPCRAAWDIAGRLGVPRMAVSCACEALGIRIKPCQLGAF
jgi:hypothetical protein